MAWGIHFPNTWFVFTGNKTLAQNTHICAKQFLVLQLSLRHHSHKLNFQVSTFINLQKKSEQLLLFELYLQQSLYFNTDANGYSTTDAEQSSDLKYIFSAVMAAVCFSLKPQIPNSSDQDTHLVNKTWTSLAKLFWKGHFLLRLS